MEITSSRLSAVNKAFNIAFQAGLQGAATQMADIFLETDSTNEIEAYEWLNTIGGLQVFTGEGKFQDLSTSGYEIKNQEFQSGVDVKSISIQRDREGVYKPSFELLGSRAAQHKDELIGSLLLGGFTQLDYTGTPFFSLNKKHAPNVDGGKAKTPLFSNLGTKKFSSGNYDVARLSLLARLDRDGRPMRLGKKLKLLCGSSQWAACRDVVENAKLTGGADNPNFGTAELILMPEIDSTARPDAWFLIDVGYPVKPFILQNEIPVTLESQTDPNSDTVFINKVFKYQAYASRGAGYGLPQLAYGSTGVAAA